MFEDLFVPLTLGNTNKIVWDAYQKCYKTLKTQSLMIITDTQLNYAIIFTILSFVVTQFE